jgi:hypothetical protein
LTEEPERIERRQQLRIFEILSAGPFPGNRLEQRAAVPSDAHHDDLSVNHEDGSETFGPPEMDTPPVGAHAPSIPD